MSTPPGGTATQYALFAACAPGLEALLQEELAELGLGGAATPGGVELRTDARGLWELCWRARLAESVRVRLKPFVARDFETLVQGLTRLPWRAYLRSGSVASVHVVARRSRLWHSDAVAERVSRVLRERAGVETAARGEAGTRIHVRLQNDRVQVSVDASGERLHRRGYRTHVAEASLRETLAAALARVARREAPEADVLWDPFCGAGTIAIEWLELLAGGGGALLEQRLGAGGARPRFAFEDWPTHDAESYRLWTAQQQAPEARFAGVEAERPLAFGSDVSEKALGAAQANARAAGLEARCRWIQGDFESAAQEIPEGAVVISNPPYGVRVRQSRELLARLSRLLLRRPDLRPVVLLLPADGLLERRSSLPFEARFRTSNGGLAVALEVLSGARR